MELHGFILRVVESMSWNPSDIFMLTSSPDLSESAPLGGRVRRISSLNPEYWTGPFDVESRAQTFP